PGGAASITNGARVFASTGCALCHTPRYMTGNSAVAALAVKNVDLFSDLLIHDMGVGLADGRSEEHTSELQSRFDLVCRPLLAKKHSTCSAPAPPSCTPSSPATSSSAPAPASTC